MARGRAYSGSVLMWESPAGGLPGPAGLCAMTSYVQSARIGSLPSPGQPLRLS